METTCELLGQLLCKLCDLAKQHKKAQRVTGAWNKGLFGDALERADLCSSLAALILRASAKRFVEAYAQQRLHEVLLLDASMFEFAHLAITGLAFSSHPRPSATIIRDEAIAAARVLPLETLHRCAELVSALQKLLRRRIAFVSAAQFPGLASEFERTSARLKSAYLPMCHPTTSSGMTETHWFRVLDEGELWFPCRAAEVLSSILAFCAEAVMLRSAEPYLQHAYVLCHTEQSRMAKLRAGAEASAPDCEIRLREWAVRTAQLLRVSELVYLGLMFRNTLTLQPLGDEDDGEEGLFGQWDVASHALDAELGQGL